MARTIDANVRRIRIPCNSRFVTCNSGSAGPVRRAQRLQPPAVGRSDAEPSPQFGRVTTVALNQMRFFSFGIRGTF